MKKFLAYLFYVTAVLACSGNIDPEENQDQTPQDETPADPPKDPATEVPDGVLRVFADKTEIAADGSDEVTFKVMFGSEDVSNAKTMQLIRTFDGGSKYMSYGANKFSTTTAGTYKFKAEYYHAGKHYSDNEVKVTAAQFFTGEEKEYVRRVLAVYFTSTGCTSCPSASKGIKTVQEENPGMVSVVAFHENMGGPDPMKTPETDLFRAGLGNFTGLPRLFWNLRTGTELIGPDFTESFAEEIEAYDPNCGVRIDTDYDESSRELDITVGITSNLPSVYRYHIFLVEDKLDSKVLGSSYEQCGDPYVHDNVVRDVLSSSVAGEKMNDNLPLTIGVEVTVSKKVVLPKEWNADNMRVIVSALSSSDGGYTWVVNNTAECGVGSEVSYEYEE